MSTIRHSVQVFLVVLVATATTNLWAQDEEAVRARGDAGSLEADLERFWAAERDIRVLEHRLYQKAGRHQVSIFGGVIPNDPFMDYYPVGLRYEYYLLESLSIGVEGSFVGDVMRAESDLKEFLSERGVSVALLDRQWWRGHFGVNWSPFYGKIAFLGLKLVHFDLNLHAGFGVVEVHSPSEERLEEDVEYKPEGSLGAGFNFHLSQLFSLRIDYRQYIFEKAGGGVSNPSEITLGFSVFI